MSEIEKRNTGSEPPVFPVSQEESSEDENSRDTQPDESARLETTDLTISSVGSSGSAITKAEAVEMDVASVTLPAEALNSQHAHNVDALDPLTSSASNGPQVDMLAEWLRVALIPIVIVVAFAIGIAMLGLAQRNGWIVSMSEGVAGTQVSAESAESAESYICPMMCVPPTSQPGRCPVCAMELVPAASGTSSGPSSTIEIDSRSRRVAGIKTVAAKAEIFYREVRGVGEISYNESNLKTLSAYIDGRIEELDASYTGVQVQQGEKLAMLYSPDLYSAQVEYIRTLEFSDESTTRNARVADSNRRMLASARTRLIELGLTEDQVKDLESSREPHRRVGLYAPMSGTVIQLMAKTGQYLKAGTPVYKLADLTTVWLVLELFPEDARLIRIGQPVSATTHSKQGRVGEGVVEFIEPTVDPKTRTVGVRISLDNHNGEFLPGEFARATLRVPVLTEAGEPQPTVTIPRDSLLSVGATSLVYVEGKPGQFEIRRVRTSPSVDGMVAVFEGVTAGEFVVAKSAFLLDAQMQLQGNPSLIDPDKAVVDSKESTLTEAELEEIRLALEPLSQADRELALAQEICPVTEVRLGSMGMGTPIKIDVNGSPVFICCEGCRNGLMGDVEKNLKILSDYAEGKRDKGSQETPDHTNSAPSTPNDLPQMELPQMELPQMELPKEPVK